MKIFDSIKNKEVAKSIKNGDIGVVPTDTLYGLVGKIDSIDAIERIYETKRRDTKKPLIVLIADLSDLTRFEVKFPVNLEDIWPAKLSVILPCDKYSHLHRGKRSIAFRIPDNSDLIELIKETGPIVAPSANPEGASPAKTIEEAISYFEDSVDFYVRSGRLESKPSTLVKYNEGSWEVLREGEVNLRQLL